MLKLLVISLMLIASSYGKAAFAQAYPMADLVEEAHGLREEGKYRKAIKLYIEAAEAGNPEAMNAIGVMAVNGWGMSKNEARGFTYVKDAAEMGYPNAQKNLAEFYEKGIRVRKNQAKANYWYSKYESHEKQELKTSNDDDKHSSQAANHNVRASDQLQIFGIRPNMDDSQLENAISRLGLKCDSNFILSDAGAVTECDNAPKYSESRKSASEATEVKQIRFDDRMIVISCEVFKGCPPFEVDDIIYELVKAGYGSTFSSNSYIDSSLRCELFTDGSSLCAGYVRNPLCNNFCFQSNRLVLVRNTKPRMTLK